VSIFTILSFRYFVSYFIFEIRIPHWTRHASIDNSNKNNLISVSFLLPAYNEEKHIKRCIESIDLAASRYPSKTEIIVINDGSTDKTRDIASLAVLGLKYASGRVYNIPNSGKGFALQYGLKQTNGDIVFRIDSDSAIDKNAIAPIMNHFQDPTVGSVSGLILPLEEKNWIQKIWILQLHLLVFYRREWELIDSVLSQPGAFSAYRKDALIKVGGWADHQLGEDGEITVRLGRCGYRNAYESHSISYSDVPSNLMDLREQRVRWCIAFYHARAANLNVIREFKGPLSFVYGLALLRQVSILASGLFVPFIIAQAVIGNNFSIYNLTSILGISFGLMSIELLTYGLQGIVNTYFLFKSKRLDLIKYLPFIRLYDLIHSMFFEPEAAEILLLVSSRWKEHNKELSQALRKKIKEGI
jgi:biofilm PGA synthesis N-glycosyltransferase PgaC